MMSWGCIWIRRPCGRFLLRREEPDPGTGPDAARIAAEEGPGRHHVTHDNERHGTTTLFAALNVATGETIHECMPRHRHQEFLRFLKNVEKSVEPGLELHVVLDTYATHKHEKIRQC